MKNKLTVYLKILLLLMLVSLSQTTCERDTSFTTEPDDISRFIIKNLNNQQVFTNEKLVEKLKKFKPIFRSGTHSGNTREIYNEEYDFTINTDNVKYVEDSENGLHSYNFPIFRGDPGYDNLENLLLMSNNQGTYDAYIVKYDFTPDELDTLDEETLNNSITEYYPIDFDTSIFNDSELSRYTMNVVCVQVWHWVKVGETINFTPVYGWVLQSEECTVIGGTGNSGTDADTTNSTSNTGTGDDSCDNCGTNGGGDSSSDTTNEDNIISSPSTTSLDDKQVCDNIRAQIENTDFIEKMEILRDSAGINNEIGFAQNAEDGTFDPIPKTNSGHSLNLNIGLSSDIKGYMHTHLDDISKDINADGVLDIIKPIRMFSPNDIKSFLLIAFYASFPESNYEQNETYAVMVSSDGEYMLKFTGDPNDIPQNTTLMNLNEREKRVLKRKYKNKVKRSDIEKRERNFLRFLKDYIGIDGIRLYKLKSDGKIVEKKLDENNELENKTCS